MAYFPEISSAFQKFAQALRGQKVAVLGHKRPDGDCIGSQVALTRVLSQMGIQAQAHNSDMIPRLLREFVGDTPFLERSRKPEEVPVAIYVDCADHLRVGDDLAKCFPKPFLNIDHHPSNTLFAEHNLVVPTACATAHILAGIFLDNNITIDPITAQALYLGIATDTGQFSYPATTAEVFEICKILVDRGASPAQTAEYVHQRETIQKLELTRRFLDSLKLEDSGRICIGCLRSNDFKETQTLAEDAEGLVDLTRSIGGVEVGVYLQEQAEGVKGSLRAKDPRMRLDLFAKQYNGGGHFCAAGFYAAKAQINTFYIRFVEALIQHIKQIDSNS